ncbi:MAG TPA: CGNR zinc finger domain-containing protein [Jatrophihabitans sp.]|nr:CGNR zinc finger domain-containing protein [Jatrophihabitans sp.]
MVTEEGWRPIEVVRGLLNTWRIPDEQPRTPVDVLGAVLAEPAAAEEWPDLAAGPDDEPALREVRNALRRLVEAPRDAAALAAVDELVRARLVGRLEPVADGSLRAGWRPRVDSPDARVLVAFLRAVADGDWRRTRACPDCHWVFVDRSRNNTRVWCSMGGVGSRACGSAAKMRRYRARSAAGHG